VTHFAGAKKVGATDAEIEETVQLAASVGAVVLAMADRAREASDRRHLWWKRPRGDEAP
jgi:alkylhydroperoxidase/carboxymuconolactone decarboxylase family protein YurZ